MAKMGRQLRQALARLGDSYFDAACFPASLEPYASVAVAAYSQALLSSKGILSQAIPPVLISPDMRR